MNFRLQSLKLHNYCQFQDFTFTPSPQGVTVLVGNNGAGKSNLLHSVCHALAPLIQILGSKSGTALKLPEECVSVKNNVKATNTNIQAEALLNDTLLSWTIFPKTSPRTEQPQQPPLKQQMSAASLAQPPLFRFFSAHAFETKNNEKLIQDFSPQTALENCLNDSNSLLLSWLFTQMKRKATAKRKKDKETETAISRQTDYVLNLLSIFAPTKEASPLSWHIKEQTLMIPQPKGGILPLSMLSDSDRFRLLLAGDLICRSVLLDPYGTDPVANMYGLVLIDNGMRHQAPYHPPIMLHLLQSLFPNVQFITSSHNPLDNEVFHPITLDERLL